jgi:hypothetical protein
MADPIELCWEKIRRAETRLDELKEEIGRFFPAGDEPYDIPGEYDAKAKRFTFYFQTRGEPPPVLDAIIGEISHGLRSSLNNLAAALSGTPNADGDFPIFTAEHDFLARGKPKTKGMSARHQAAIECMQPYQRREPDETPLAILNRLARIDKHRDGTFSVIADVYPSFNFKAVRDISGYGAVELFAGVMKTGDPLAKVEVIPTGPKPELHMNVDFSAGIAFGKKWTLPHPFPRLIREVTDIVEAFAAFP